MLNVKVIGTLEIASQQPLFGDSSKRGNSLSPGSDIHNSPEDFSNCCSGNHTRRTFLRLLDDQQEMIKENRSLAEVIEKDRKWIDWLSSAFETSYTSVLQHSHII